MRALIFCITVALICFATGCEKANQNTATGTAKRSRKTEELAKRGEQLVRQMGCVACHSLDGSKKVGSSFRGMYLRQTTGPDGEAIERDERYLKKQIVSPSNPSMPQYDSISDESLDAIIQYIRSLGKESDG